MDIWLGLGLGMVAVGLLGLLVALVLLVVWANPRSAGVVPAPSAAERASAERVAEAIRILGARGVIGSADAERIAREHVEHIR